MLTLRLPMPPSVNSAYANRKGPGKGRVSTAALRSWKAAAGVRLDEALASIPQRPVFTGLVHIAIRLPVNWASDADNRAKAIPDLLKAHGVLIDDKAKYVCGVHPTWVYDGSLGDEVEVIITVVSELPAGASRERRTAAKRGRPVGGQRPDLSPVLEAHAKPQKRPSLKAPTDPSDAAVVRAIAAKLGVRPERVHLTGGGSKQNRI